MKRQILIVTDSHNKDQLKAYHEKGYDLIAYNSNSSKLWINTYRSPLDDPKPLHNYYWSYILNNTTIPEDFQKNDNFIQNPYNIHIFSKKLITLDDNLPTLNSSLKALILFNNLHGNATHLHIAEQYNRTFRSYHVNTPQRPSKIDPITQHPIHSNLTVNSYDPHHQLISELNQFNRILKQDKENLSKENYKPTKIPEETSIRNFRWHNAYGLDLPPLTLQDAYEHIRIGRQLGYYLNHNLETNDTHKVCTCGYPLTPVIDLKDASPISAYDQIGIYEQEITCPKCLSTYTLDDFYPEPDHDDYLDYNPKPTWHTPRCHTYKARLVAGNFIME